MRDITGELERSGFTLVFGVLSPAQTEFLKQFFEIAHVARAERQGQTYGARNLLALPEIRSVAQSQALRAILDPLIGADCRAVRGLFFDKTDGANWPVLWHQDLSLAVKQRHDLPGWTNWSVKRGVQHVQPPPDVLARMVTVRLHLDDCPADNGPLRVVPGSHRLGLLSRDTIRDAVNNPTEVVTASAGDGLLMRPLILHASSPAARPRHRRVLHLEFAPAGLLPAELDWSEAA
jgi:ectoine hydroxylase-related dioxygenase (phytanoyl-CoA dioxygenase family)